MGESPIRLANELMTIFEACAEVGMGDVSGMAKTYCPFGNLWHADGGRTRAFKVYPESNSAYCFACQQYFTPVKLIGADKDMGDVEAANWILEYKHYVKPDYVERWRAMTEEVPLADADSLSEALKLACARMTPDWDSRQLEEPVARKLTQCLSIVRKIQTEEQAQEWFEVSKKAMSNVLARVDPTS